jgi:hypothetical protein
MAHHKPVDVHELGPRVPDEHSVRRWRILGTFRAERLAGQSIVYYTVVNESDVWLIDLQNNEREEIHQCRRS